MQVFCVVADEEVWCPDFDTYTTAENVLVAVYASEQEAEREAARLRAAEKAKHGTSGFYVKAMPVL